MEEKIFSVRDNKAELFLEPFFARNAEVALRGFSEAVNTSGHQFNRHPDDFDLFELGTYSPEDGSIAPNALGPHHYGSARAYLKSEVV